MQRCTCLKRLNKAFAGRIRRLERIAHAIATSPGADDDQKIAFVAIEGQSAWSTFTREFFLSCALLKPKTISGQHVSHGVGPINEHIALAKSIHTLKGKAVSVKKITPRDEPAWHEKRVLPALSKAFGMTNSVSIVSGLSYPTSVFDDLPTMRNFYAHRSHLTVIKARRLASRKYGRSPNEHPNAALSSRTGAGTQTLLQEWLSDMRQVALAVCD